MGIFDNAIRSLGRKLGIDYTTDELGQRVTRFGSIDIPETLTDSNAFTLANTVTEIYHPIDFYADRASKLRYFIADKDGNEIPNTELNRFIKNINPLYSFSDLIYQYVFSYLSAGYAIPYVTVPSTYKKHSVNSITRLDILQPNMFEFSEYSGVSMLDVSNISDLIHHPKYGGTFQATKQLNILGLRIDNIDSTRQAGSQVLSRSPLFKAIRPINNLLATYSARLNIYTNNGAAGYLFKQRDGKSGVEEAINPVTRDEILKDINDRNGLTGNRNLWGLSSVPLGFINTLSDIQKLMPFEETFEDSIKIASIYQIPADLVPRKDNSTFDNQIGAERSVWENGIMSMVNTVCENITKALTLDKVGAKIKADYSTVSCFKSNESASEDLTTKRLANLMTINQMYPDNTQVKKEIDKILLGYGQK